MFSVSYIIATVAASASTTATSASSIVPSAAATASATASAVAASIFPPVRSEGVSVLISRLAVHSFVAPFLLGARWLHFIVIIVVFAPTLWLAVLHWGFEASSKRLLLLLLLLWLLLELLLLSSGFRLRDIAPTRVVTDVWLLEAAPDRLSLWLIIAELRLVLLLRLWGEPALLAALRVPPLEGHAPRISGWTRILLLV